jgi:hypothetical protein
MTVASSRAHRVDVTENIDAILANADYASTYAAAINDDGGVRSAEQCARATFECAPAGIRRLVVAGWRYVLGLRLAHGPSPDHVLGWTISRRSEDSILLEARSRILTARKLVRVHSSLVAVTTFVRYERSIARPIWALVALVHHRTEPYLLNHSAARGSSADDESKRGLGI